MCLGQYLKPAESAGVKLHELEGKKRKSELR